MGAKDWMLCYASDDVSKAPEGEVYAAVFPGLSIVCTCDAAGDAPTQLDERFVREAAGRTLYLHAMHSVVDFFAYAIWSPDGTVRRAFNLSPDSVYEDDDPDLGQIVLAGYAVTPR